MLKRMTLGVTVFAATALILTRAYGAELLQLLTVYDVGQGWATYNGSGDRGNLATPIYNGSYGPLPHWTLIGYNGENYAANVKTRVGTFLDERSTSYCANQKVTATRYRRTEPWTTGSCGSLSGYTSDSAVFQHTMNTCDWGWGYGAQASQGSSIEADHSYDTSWMNSPTYDSGYYKFAYQVKIYSETYAPPYTWSNTRYSCYTMYWSMHPN